MCQRCTIKMPTVKSAFIAEKTKKRRFKPERFVVIKCTKTMQNHHTGAPLSLFQFIQLLIQRGNVMNTRASFIENFMQKRIRQQVDQTVD
ncbi:hypothetical protein SAMN05216286_1037 [Kosakonia oryzae]|uniref:Uncharacterized protein n=1 Tax=Kosakonia oryzae TaxID=497725 RepID=A0AA94KNV3_9ENTR|nr:hypothetical protein SAMN05216286_1037 [Kosakonia oryzae]